MPIFISYSHHDSGFVGKLAAQLVKHKARVWVDTWELNVGDSIVDRIQDAIQTATALVVILSKASVESEWCKKELSAGLLRELEERRVVVLPVLVEECEIPIFLRGKLYADFRKDYDAGLETILEAIARVTSDGQGRLERPEWHVDWAIDWSFVDQKLFLRLIAVEQAKNNPDSVLSEMQIVANDVGTLRFRAFVEHGLEWIEQLAILQMIAVSMKEGAFQFVIDNEFPKIRTATAEDPTLGTKFRVTVSARRMGEDNGKAVFLDYGEQFKQIIRQLQDTRRKPSPHELEAIREFLAKL